MKRFAILLLALLGPACGSGAGPLIVNWYVDAATGNDVTGVGTPALPFRTITKALTVAIGGDYVFVSPGTYNAGLGEVFPLRIKQAVTVEGDTGTHGAGILISGGGNYTVQGGGQVGAIVSAAVVIESKGALAGVTVTNGAGVGVVLEKTTTNGLSALQFNTITANGSDGVRVYQSGKPSLWQNLITANTGNGLLTYDSTAPKVEDNTLTNNGVDGIRALDTSNPTLADGGNILQGNTGVGLFNDTTASVIVTAAPGGATVWRLSVQGSSGTGTYPASTQMGPVAYAAGNNFAITNAAAGIRF